MAHNPQIEVDPGFDSDGGYESASYESSTTTLSSTVYTYIYENGRRYHSYFGAEKNLHPTDQKEQERLDLHHEIMTELLGGDLYNAPIGDTPHMILDVGTGTGIWACEMAEKFPMAVVLGTDLSPIQPKWIPPNCMFEVDDCEKGWATRPDRYDFVHLRNLAQSITLWPKVLSEVYRVTKPGGYVELGEIGAEILSDDNSIEPGNPLIKIFDLINKEALPRIGRFSDSTYGPKMKESLEKAGFEDVQVRMYKNPLGPWPKDKRMKHIGAMCLLGLESGIEAYALAALTRILKMDPVDVENLSKDAWAAAKNRSSHMYTIYSVVFGRKPEY